MTEQSIWSATTLTTATGGDTIGDPQADRVVTDSRGDLEGALFVALTGPNFDGHDFVRAALKAGAAGAVVSRAWWGTVRTEAVRPLLVVEDTLTALQDLSAAHRKRFDIPIAAITGSSGKSTTKELLATALTPLGNVHRTAGNRNNHIGVPLTLLDLRDTHDAAVLELGMNAAGEIALLAGLSTPSTAVITNVSEAHLQGLKNRAGVAGAKAEIVEGLDADTGCLVLPAGDPDLNTALSAWKGRRVTFGLEPEADVRATDITLSDQGTGFTLSDGTRVSLKLLGEHNVLNALAALAAARELGLAFADAARGMATVEPMAGRLVIRRAGGVVFLDDSYNANPASMRAAFSVLENFPATRRFALVGDMLELGRREELIHFAAGEQASFVDGIVTIGELAARFAQGALRDGMTQRKWHQVADHDHATERMLRLLQPGDVVLVKGSRGARLEVTLEAVMKGLGGEDA